MFANLRSTLPYKNFDVVEKTVNAGNLDPKFVRAINTGIFYPETADVIDDASDAEDDMPELIQGSVGSGDENDWDSDGGEEATDAAAPSKQEPRAYNRPGQSRPAPNLQRGPITEEVKQHVQQIERKEAKVRAARRRQDGGEVRARAERPEELFLQEREERTRLRAEKGFVVDEEDEENPKVYTCCLKELQTDLQGNPKVNAAALVCKYDPEEYGIRAGAHRLRIDCEKGHELRCHHPSCLRSLTYSGLHSKEQPWGKMDAKNTSQQLSKEGVVMKCLKAGCDGRIVRTAIEKDRGVRRAEVWYHAKWHQDLIDEEERQKKQQEEEAARVRAEAEEQRKQEQKAADVEAKKAAKVAAKAAKEAARRPDLVGLDGVQVPVPPKKPQKARAQEAPKPDVPKPDISEVERMIEQEGSAAVQPRESDDVFAAVPQIKRKDKKKEKKDKKKKVLDVEFGERDDAENVEATGAEAIVEQAVARAQPPEAPDAGSSARHVEDFPDLAPGPAQASGETASLAMLEARNFREEDDSIPVTPFLLCKNLDATTLRKSAAQQKRTFQQYLPRFDVRQVRGFEEAGCAAIEVNYYDGGPACNSLNGQLLGSKPVVVSHLIEFPDEELMSGIAAARDAGEDGDGIIRYIVGERRKARAQRNLPTREELQAKRAAQPRARPPPPPQEPAGKASLPSVPPSMNPVEPVSLPSSAAPPMKPAPPAPAGPAPATTAARAAPTPPTGPAVPDRSYEDADKWLRSSENPNAGIQAIPQIWVSVTDLFVLPLRSQTLTQHYLRKTVFNLDYKFFPQFRECVARGGQFSAALVFYEKETGKFYGVMRMEPGRESKAACKPFISNQTDLREAASQPSLPKVKVDALKDPRGGSQHFVSTHAWQILNAFTESYDLSA